MRNNGFVRIAAGSPEIKVADCAFNLLKTQDLMRTAMECGVDILVLPEMGLTGYTIGDLVRQQLLLESAQRALLDLARSSQGNQMVTLVGLPIQLQGKIFNCGAVVQDGRVLGLVPKTYIPSNNEFYDQRWFSSADDLTITQMKLGSMTVPIGVDLLFASVEDQNVCFGVEICEDLWVPSPPSSNLARQGALMLFNLSASNELIGKSQYRESLVLGQSARCLAAYAYSSANATESSTDLVFGGHCLIAEAGKLVAKTNRFELTDNLAVADVDVQRLLHDRTNMATFHHQAPKSPMRIIEVGALRTRKQNLLRIVEKHPFVPTDVAMRAERCREIVAIQTAGLTKRMTHTSIKKLVIGVSGGLDSTLALIIASRTLRQLHLPASNLIAVTMPGFGTTDRTYQNAIQLMRFLGCDKREIDIKPACIQHFKDIGHDPLEKDITYENVQARERTQLLMDIGNRETALVVGTGDLSELALGWCTYNGDHMSMYAVNVGVPKTLVQYVIGWYRDMEAPLNVKQVLTDILETPISPELLPPSPEGGIVQKTEDIVGPYELHDFFLYHLVRYGAKPTKILALATHAYSADYSEVIILKWLKLFLRRFFAQQFKRSCLPDGPKIGTITLSPRGDWRMPSDASVELWLSELDGGPKNQDLR